jgi:predicted CXXCH cytochrome family protein
MKPAVCSSCHGNHDILKASDATSHVNVFNIPATCGKCHSNASYMKQYGIPVSQLDDYTGSVHGVALLKKHDAAAPACNSCHGNHGATPPGVQSIGNVCGTCHVLNAQLFAKSMHKKIFDEQNLPECQTCHGKHGIQPATESLLSTGEGTVCGRCHTESKAPNGYNAAVAMKRLLDSLTSDEKTSGALINAAEQKGMEVSDAKFKLRDVRQARLKSKTAVHSFNLKDFESVVGEGLKITGMAKTEAETAIHEFYFRRWGLGVSTLIITLLAVGIWLFIKRMERGSN